jgi:hypothetical protein
MRRPDRERMVVVAEFYPPDARAQFEAWRAGLDAKERAGQDDWVIDIGRALGGGDCYRVRAPRSAPGAGDLAAP